MKRNVCHCHVELNVFKHSVFLRPLPIGTRPFHWMFVSCSRSFHGALLNSASSNRCWSSWDSGGNGWSAHCWIYLTEDPKNEAFTDWCGGHLIAAYYSFIYPGRIKCWAGLVGWLTADSLPAWVVTHQLHDASIHPSIHAGRAQDSESSPVKDFERPTFYHCATQPTYKLGIDDRGYSYMVSPYTVTDMTCKCHTSRTFVCFMLLSQQHKTHERTWSVKCWARSVCDG